jgi:hypothetical protein
MLKLHIRRCVQESRAEIPVYLDRDIACHGRKYRSANLWVSIFGAIVSPTLFGRNSRHKFGINKPFDRAISIS